MRTERVIIVGGGLNGLTMAALLADFGVPCVVIERHEATSIQYKFAGISPRSIEIFRGLDVEQEIRAQRTGDQQGGAIARGKTLADPEIEIGGAAWPDATPFGPTQPATCDQHVLEPILRRRAEALGADVRFGVECLSIDQDEQGVHARVRSVDGGAETTLDGAYLIGADGAAGTTRERCGIAAKGAGVLQHWINIIFDTDLPPTLNGRRFTSCFVTSINATLTPRDGGRWLLAMQYDPKRERPEQFDAQRCRDLVRRGAGRPEVRADLVDARAWSAAASVAEVFHRDRCFLIGDAAHLMPPTGAFGGNSGIHDAHNLAWKLAYVLRGAARRQLLDTYDAERRPVIEATLGQALARLQRWFKDLGGQLPPPPPLVPDYDVVFGQRYRAGAILPDATGSWDARQFADHTKLSAEPGTRVPQCVVEHEGRVVSTVDVVWRDMTLICSRTSTWCDAARGVNLACVALDDAAARGNRAWPEVFAIEPDGAVLVRPDAFVAWRSRQAVAQPAAVLAAALTKLGLRSGAPS